jgi:hypothetical protein
MIWSSRDMPYPTTISRPVSVKGGSRRI